MTIAWLDIETTGLDPKHDFILEVGMTITDDDLRILAHRSGVIGWRIGHKNSILDARLNLNDQFTRKMHTSNGLLDAIAASGYDQWTIERNMFDFMSVFPDKPVMGGSSISFDRSFLAAHMPNLLDTFHYRSIDVTSIRECAHRWRPDLTDVEPKALARHRVEPDIEDSICLAQFYQYQIFQLPEEAK